MQSRPDLSPREGKRGSNGAPRIPALFGVALWGSLPLGAGVSGLPWSAVVWGVAPRGSCGGLSGRGAPGWLVWVAVAFSSGCLFPHYTPMATGQVRYRLGCFAFMPSLHFKCLAFAD